MNEKIIVLGKYNVYIGSGILTRFSKLVNLKKYSNIIIITDKSIEKHWLKKIKGLPQNPKKIILQSGEQSKNIDTVQEIWQKFLLSGCDRKTLVINLGGGVILDMGGFAASTYMRGVSFINIPTTLLAQVDASIGGKTGIDFMGIKNLIGTFNQPVAVIVDTAALSTLPKREFLSGFAEIIKHGLIYDKEYFQKVTSKDPLQFTDKELIEIIAESIKIKAKIIGGDHTEENCRKILNFGHTVGHAIESLSLKSTTPLLHGEAISIGMFIEAKISRRLKLLSPAAVQIVKQGLTRAGLPISAHLAIDKTIKLMRSDKKNEKGKINFTLLSGIGKAVINQFVPESIIKKELV